MEQLDVLKQENDRLRVLAQQDPLTGLLNRRALEARISDALGAHTPGVLLMLDVDQFKYINDSYGHLTGDRTLRELARAMSNTFGEGDIVGRLGGDEFIIFLPGEYTRAMVESLLERLGGRIAQAERDLRIGNGLRITVGAEFSGAEDTFLSLYGRADTAMRTGKSNWRKSLLFYEPYMEDAGLSHMQEQRSPFSAVDMKYISRQLRENSLEDGAFCQDYSTFLSIYRFLERGLGRTGLRVHLILISLTDRYGSFVPLEEREFLVEKLRESLRTTLRFSDIYTQYSSCQFLAMALGAGQENMDIITSRVQNAFRVRVPDRPDVLLSFSFYPLQPAARQKKAEIT